MKVLKFGGTSVGSAKNINQIKQIVSQKGDSVIVVVSALGGVTDLLIKAAETAATGNRDFADVYQAISERHQTMIDALISGSAKTTVENRINELLKELFDILQGVFYIHEVSARTLDTIVAYGERLSSYLIANAIDGASLADSREYIVTELSHGKHLVNFTETDQRIVKALTGFKGVLVAPGFISSNAKGETTTLGRGGSDYTAAIFAAALHAEILEIWTDVDGFMTADPRVISTAYVIDHLSYAEAMELSHFGAKVIYPPTIYPVFQKNIPIKILNTMNPSAPGTLIDNMIPTGVRKAIKGISAINDTSLITMSGAGMVGVIGINYRLFKALADANISVFLVSQASSENSTTFAVKNQDAEKADAALRREFSKEIEHGDISTINVEKDLATVAIVGENMKHTPGIAGKLFSTLGRNGVNVIACAQGASELNISFVIKLTELRKALNGIHDSFFLSEYSVMNLFIAGVGTVGSSLLGQIAKQQQKLQDENKLKLRVVGISNSKKFITNRAGIEPANYKQALAESEHHASPEKFRDEIVKLNMFNSVFVDCTASSNVATIYNELLRHNVHVVTANKVAASSAYSLYRQLKESAQLRGVKFLYETNVGAGLPIINTMNALIKSGDKIIKLEAVLSGTLNFIFNTISSTVPLSKAIQMAGEAGYSEPDPRIDLSGIDVIRKLVILAREAGHPIEQSDVRNKPFIPAHCFEGSPDNFWKTVADYDAAFEAERAIIEQEGKRWRFVATFQNGIASVERRAVDARHPFYDLEGSNNIILLTTERYNEYPMMIKGYGAGASVTAAGVFADIISIANL